MRSLLLSRLPSSRFLASTQRSSTSTEEPSRSDIHWVVQEPSSPLRCCAKCRVAKQSMAWSRCALAEAWEPPGYLKVWTEDLTLEAVSQHSIEVKCNGNYDNNNSRSNHKAHARRQLPNCRRYSCRLLLPRGFHRGASPGRADY